MVTLFDGDDAAYLNWLRRNTNGYVVNIRRRVDPSYVVLHRATCALMLRHRDIETNPGGFTERKLRKVCGTSISEIERFLDQLPEGPYSVSKACSQCKPY